MPPQPYLPHWVEPGRKPADCTLFQCTAPVGAFVSQIIMRPYMTLPAMGNSGAPCLMMTPTGVPPGDDMCSAFPPACGFVASTTSVAVVVVTVHAAARSAAVA